MQRKILIFLIFLSSLALMFFIGYWVRGNFMSSKTAEHTSLVDKIIPKPLEAYSIKNLAQSSYPAGKFEYKKDLFIDPEGNYITKLYWFTFRPNPESKDTKKTSVVINVPIPDPTSNLTYPLIVMNRGYVDPTGYTSGDGTRRAATVFAKGGFITVAPDFLGYGESDINSSNIFESRFQTYTTVLALLNSLASANLPWDGKNIALWGHSNGGQISLTTLAITKKPYPTVLWAPVSKPFPYSVLYYTDTSDDRGKLIRHELGKFEDLYNTDDFSFDLHFDAVNGPIQLHQGTADDLVPETWSRELAKQLKAKDKEIDYYVYPAADHNLQPSWTTVVSRSLEFYKHNLQN